MEGPSSISLISCARFPFDVKLIWLNLLLREVYEMCKVVQRLQMNIHFSDYTVATVHQMYTLGLFWQTLTVFCSAYFKSSFLM